MRWLVATLAVSVLSGSERGKPLQSKWDNARINQAFLDFLPPRRVAFPVSISAPLLVAKIVDDVGEFYPFSAAHTRRDWDKAGYLAVNAVLEGADVQGTLVDLIGSLDDPATMIMKSGEGRGNHVLPVLFSVEEGGKGGIRVRLTGGDESSRSHEGNRLTSINGEPLHTFLRARLGSKIGADRAAGCLSRVFVRTAAFNILLGFEGGSQLRVESIASSAKNPWIRGGWKGTPLHLLDGLSPKDLSGLKEIDARLLGWFPAMGNKLGQSFTLIKRGAMGRGIQRAYRAHDGLTDNPSSYPAYSSHYRTDAFENDPVLKAPSLVAVLLPQGRVVSPIIDEIAGWGLEGSLEWPGDQVWLDLVGDCQMVMRTSTYCHGGSRKQWTHSGTYSFGSLLSEKAAVAVAAARILNFDHLYGHTPGRLQESLYKGVLENYQAASNVQELLRRLGPYVQDAHVGTLDLLGVTFTDSDRPIDVFSAPPQGSRKTFPFIMTVSGSGKTRVLWHFPDPGPQSIPVGAEIVEIDGVGTQELVAMVRADYSSPNESPDRLGTKLAYLLENKPVHTFVYKDSKGSLTKCEVPEGNKKYPSIIPPVPVPAGWTLLNTPKQITSSELVRRLGDGENFVLDTRKFGTGVVTLSDTWFTNAPHPAMSFKTLVQQPMNWGNSLLERQYHASYGIDRGVPPKAPLKGMVVMLLSGNDQSRDETWKTLFRMQLESNLYTIGFKTAGITGELSILDLPGGGGKPTRYLYTPTGTWVAFGGDTLNYRGVHLDEELDIEDVFRNGTDDPLLAMVLRRIAGSL